MLTAAPQDALDAASPLASTLPDPSRALELVRRTLELEGQELNRLLQRLQGEMSQAVARALSFLYTCEGRVVVSGMGKSGHVARKMAATLASTGTPAFFLHPAEASHGDLGMVTERDVFIALSNSGASEELLRILPLIKRLAVPLIVMTGAADSPLAREAEVVLDTSVLREACPLDLAPTTSTTVQLALGDALAVALLDARGFGAEDFARAHPGGSLGRKLLRVRDVMHAQQQLPQVGLDASLDELLAEVSSKGLGLVAVVDEHGALAGVFTDGDLRRLLQGAAPSPTGAGSQPLQSRLSQLTQCRARDVMHRNPRVVRADSLASEAVHLLEQHRVNQLLVVDERHNLVGALNMHDLFRAKVL